MNQSEALKLTLLQFMDLKQILKLNFLTDNTNAVVNPCRGELGNVESRPSGGKSHANGRQKFKYRMENILS